MKTHLILSTFLGKVLCSFHSVILQNAANNSHIFTSETHPQITAQRTHPRHNGRPQGVGTVSGRLDVPFFFFFLSLHL